MKIARFISLIFVFTVAIIASAQEADQDEMINHRAAEKVALLNEYISFMANKKKPTEDRKYWMTKALSMFVGKGYSYMLEENGVVKEGALIHIKTISGKTLSIPVRDYFLSLVYGMRSYSNLKIKIETVEKHVVEEDTEDGREYNVLFCDVYAIEKKTQN